MCESLVQFNAGC